jgi:hypothetical protein
VCVGASDMTTASGDPSSSVVCVMCIGRFPRGVPGGACMPPRLCATFDNGQYPGAAPQIFFWAVFAIFCSFVN